MNIFKKIILPVLRGAVKVVPFGNAVVEIAQNVSASANEETPPHTSASIIAQVISWAAIIWAFYTHTITLDQLLKYLGQ